MLPAHRKPHSVQVHCATDWRSSNRRTHALGVTGSALRAVKKSQRRDETAAVDSERGCVRNCVPRSSIIAASRPIGLRHVPGRTRWSHTWCELPPTQARLDLDSQQDASDGKTTRTVSAALMPPIFLRSSAVSPVQPIQAP